MKKTDSCALRGFLVQCAVGIVAGFLNLLLCSAAIALKVPLFMDTLFTVTASCFGWTAGIVAAISSHVIPLAAYRYTAPNLIFFFCSLTMVAGVRLMLFRKGAAESGGSRPLRLLILGIVLAFVISFEGGLFYYALIDITKSISGNQAISMLIYTLVTQNVPILISATLARFPVNLVDKTIAVFGGYGIFLLLQKAMFQQKSQNQTQPENPAAHDKYPEWGGV
ncbi:MAG: hypothetical protein K2N58_11220 [Treponemataceae bacterium]|nr:hypothetical protein [Treponemataceae bacterium]